MQWSAPFDDAVPGRHSRHRDDRGTKTSQLVATYRQRLENSGYRANSEASPNGASGYTSQDAQEALQRHVYLGRVRPDDRVRAFRYHCEAGIGQHDGQAVPGGAGRHDPVLCALHDQDRDGDAGNIGVEVLLPRGRAAQRRGRGRPDSDVEAVLPRLVTYPAAAEQVDVVVPV